MAATSFLSLPPEVRNMIYTYFFNLPPTKIYNDKHNDACVIIRPRKKVAGLLNIKASNSWVASEARSVFFAPYSFTIEFPCVSVVDCKLGKGKSAISIDISIFIRKLILFVDNLTLEDRDLLFQRIKLLGSYPNLQFLTLQLWKDLSKADAWWQKEAHHYLNNLLEATEHLEQKMNNSCIYTMSLRVKNPSSEWRKDGFELEGPRRDLQTLVDTLWTGRAPGHENLETGVKTSLRDEDGDTRRRNLLAIVSIDGKKSHIEFSRLLAMGNYS